MTWITERIAELEKRVAALEAAANPVQDDAGCGGQAQETYNRQSYIAACMDVARRYADSGLLHDRIALMGNEIDRLDHENADLKQQLEAKGETDKDDAGNGLTYTESDKSYIQIPPDEAEPKRWMTPAPCKCPTMPMLVEVVEAEYYDNLRKRFYDLHARFIESVEAYEVLIDNYNRLKAERGVLREIVAANDKFFAVWDRVSVWVPRACGKGALTKARGRCEETRQRRRAEG